VTTHLHLVQSLRMSRSIHALPNMSSRRGAYLSNEYVNSLFGLERLDRWNPIRTSSVQSRSCPVRFMGISSHEMGAPRQEISK
jgi:hypothetical protein